MPMLMIKCPTTGKPVPIGVNIDAKSFETASFVKNRIRCPECQQTHEWSKPDVLPLA